MANLQLYMSIEYWYSHLFQKLVLNSDIVSWYSLFLFMLLILQ